MPSLLQYRPWIGAFHSPWWSIWPIARVSLGNLLRRKLFWALYAFGLLLFLMFFFGAFLLAWAESQLNVSAQQLKMGDPSRMLRNIRQALRILNGSQDTFQYFFAYQGGIVVITLSLAGAILVGNDFTFRSLVFYLAKPIGRWQYILGKCLAVAIVVQLMTTVPALVLYGQHAFDDWSYFTNADYFYETDSGKGPAGIPLLLAVIGYGTILSIFLSVLLVATASWMRRTMPLIMVWMSLFFFLRLLANILVGLTEQGRWRLLDLWNCLTMLGQWCLGYYHEDIGPKPQPEFWEAGLVLAGVLVICLIYLNRRTRGVEIVS
jgi:hypothetical protein